MEDSEGLFVRMRKLVGDEAFGRIVEANVLLVGTGGVGSWCAEALVRSGIRRITLVDSDMVCSSNVNRQLMATTETVGQPKVEALQKRLATISPDAEIIARRERFCQDNADTFHLDDYDCIIDAIDSIPDKALLILMALRTKAKLYSSMGAALKMDPSRISVAEFWKVRGCPLARALRNRFRKEGVFPSRKFKCVFSEEHMDNQSVPDESVSDSGNGSAVHITGIFGFTLASLVLNDLVGR